jgi:hypothetical protein
MGDLALRFLTADRGICAVYLSLASTYSATDSTFIKARWPENTRRVIPMKRADKKLRTWYEKKSKKKISDVEFEEMKSNLLEFTKVLIRWNREAPQRDLNSEFEETQLVDE